MLGLEFAVSGSYGTSPNFVYSGTDSNGDPYQILEILYGGIPARPEGDGLDGHSWWPLFKAVPTEYLEKYYPLRVDSYTVRTDSGGAGRFRGGLGQATEMGCRSGGPWSVSTLIDRTGFPAAGLDGGEKGALGGLSLASGAAAKPKTVLQLEADDRVSLDPPGGGGYGDPRDRDPERVLADVVDGYVSLASARADYGVAVEYLGPPDRLVRTPDLYRIDEEATVRLRAGGAVATAAGEIS